MTSTMLLTIHLGLGALTWTGETAPAPTGPDTVTLRGVVVRAESGEPIPDAEVSVRGTRQSAVTDTAGRFVLRGVAAGVIELDVAHAGFDAYSTTVRLAGNATDVRIEVPWSPIKLDPVVATARRRRLELAGFFKRRKRGQGVFYTREEMEAAGRDRLDELLVQVPGLRREVGRGHGARIMSRGVNTVTGPCDIQYFVDGIPSSIHVPGIDLIATRDLDAVEIYRGASEVPLQFTLGRSSCGAIVIWMREGRSGTDADTATSHR